MFYNSTVPATIFQRLATWASQFQPEQNQTQAAFITQHQPSTRETLLRHARSLRQSAKFYHERLETFKNMPEEEEYFRLEAERCENAAQQIEMEIA